MDRLRLGLIPLGGDTGSADRVEAFAATLGATLGVPVEQHKAADYRALVAAFEQKLVDFAWMPPLSVARAMRSRAAFPAAIALRNGTTSYMTGLLAMRSSRVASLADLKGVRAAWVDRESASGYVVIRAALRARGVSLVDAFADEIFVRSHAEVARALREGRADVGGTCFNFVAGSVEIARSGYNDEGGLAHEAVHILAHAGPIPSDVFAVRAGVEPRAPHARAAGARRRPPRPRARARDGVDARRRLRSPDARAPPDVESLYGVVDTPVGAR